MAAFWARTDIRYATMPAARARARKIQLIRFMGDSKERDPKSHQHPNFKIPAQSWRLAEFPSL
jgi:hypothetical protein